MTTELAQLSESFSQMFGVQSPHNFQLEVARHLLINRKSVILQAPTGSGKTKAALFPLLHSWCNENASLFPRQGIYAIPLRVLADQFGAEFKQLVPGFIEQRNLNVQREVRIQTGSLAEDVRFEADLTFTTIDQLLSSLLTIPYSLSNRQANINAGAFIGSCLIFDEFHLFPVDEQGNGALATTLQLLKLLKGIVPFVLMTATFSTAMLDQLCVELDAEKIVLSQAEVNAIPSQRGKQRRYQYIAQTLSADAIIDDLIKHQRKRVIAVCNTVDRAQQLVDALVNDGRLDNVKVELLHSRFYASDRAAKETDIRREFGEDRYQWQWEATILVATQVLEVGLNITCEALHTELAPASAIVQRAGRCARFPNESGVVFVYELPEKDGKPEYAPYLDRKETKNTSDLDEIEGQSRICERTREALLKLPSDGTVLNYHAELELVNAAHAPFDQALIQQLHDNRHSLRDEITRVLREQDRRAARTLIRDIDNRTVIVHDNPTDVTLPNPYRLEGIGIRRNAVTVHTCPTAVVSYWHGN